MRPKPILALLAAAVFTSCGEPQSSLTGTWQGRRFGSDVWNMTIDGSHGRLSGTYAIEWAEEPSKVGGPLSGSRYGPDVLIEFGVQVAAGDAMCRFEARLSDDVLLSGKTACRLPGSSEFQTGHLSLRKGG